MSVLIKGMKMPKNCFDCPCYHHKVDDGYYDYEICGASGTIFNDGYASVTGHKDHLDPFVARLDNCPLIPIQEHGDLIDRKAICLTDFEIVMCNGDYKEGMKMLLEKIESVPTIIPAEEGEK